MDRSHECPHCEGNVNAQDIIPGETEDYGFHYCATAREVSIVPGFIAPTEEQLLEFVDCFQAWRRDMRERYRKQMEFERGSHPLRGLSFATFLDRDGP